MRNPISLDLAQSDTIQEQTTTQPLLAGGAQLGEHMVGSELFVAPSVLAAEFGYDANHIGRLARHAKVKAIRAGDRWFVSRSSLQSYQQTAVEQKKQRALAGVRLAREFNGGGVARRPIVVPSRALSRIAEQIRAGWVSPRSVPSGTSMRLTLLALFLFGLSVTGLWNVQVKEDPVAHAVSTIEQSESYMSVIKPLPDYGVASLPKVARAVAASPVAERQEVREFRMMPLLDQLMAINNPILEAYMNGIDGLVRIVDAQLHETSQRFVAHFVPSGAPVRPIVLEPLKLPQINLDTNAVTGSIAQAVGRSQQLLAMDFNIIQSGPAVAGANEPLTISYSLPFQNPIDAMIGDMTTALLDQVGSWADVTYTAYREFQNQRGGGTVTSLAIQAPAAPVAQALIIEPALPAPAIAPAPTSGGITLQDQVTHDPYCLTIRNGDIMLQKGICNSP